MTITEKHHGKNPTSTPPARHHSRRLARASLLLLPCASSFAALALSAADIASHRGTTFGTTKRTATRRRRSRDAVSSADRHQKCRGQQILLPRGIFARRPLCKFARGLLLERSPPAATAYSHVPHTSRCTYDGWMDSMIDAVLAPR